MDFLKFIMIINLMLLLVFPACLLMVYYIKLCVEKVESGFWSLFLSIAGSMIIVEGYFYLFIVYIVPFFPIFRELQ